jgi:two-component system, chemotaxis family, sensor kinase CheA
MSDMDAVFETFKQEVNELLVEMEEALLTLEDTPEDQETINSLFRAMHTIKGSAGLFGLNDIVAFTHEAETVLDQARNGEKTIDDDLISVLLDCKDHTEKLINHCIDLPDQDLPEELVSSGEKIVIQLTGKTKQDGALPIVNDSTQTIEMETIVEAGKLSDTWIISLAFTADAFRMGVDPLSFLRYLKNLGEIERVLLLTDDIPEADVYDPESCYLHLKIAFKSEADKQTIEDVFEFASDDCDINILPPHSKIDEYVFLLEELDDQVERLGEMLINIGVLTQNDVTRALQKMVDDGQDNKPIGETLVEQQVIQAEVVDKALEKQQKIKQKVAKDANYIRVDSGKLGQLINLVGELVISGAAMDLMVERHGLADVEEVTETMNALVNDIRDTALDLRMVPISETFNKFKRVVRDVSKELGKQIELKITGGETELDKTVIEKINDPLTHLIRNSLDHGVETPEQREQAGKEGKGCIQLNAYHQSGHVVIQIIDNGAGLNTEKILAKAISNGLVPEDHNLTQQEIYNLIFEAGLSTKAQASDLSGRGVGMDVVRRNIEALRGSVSIDSAPGQGTTITIQLPLTLAIIDGFMVEAMSERYIIPLSMVDECVEMNSGDWKVDEDQHYVNLRGVAMPFLRLGEYFNTGKTDDDKGRESLVVVRSGSSMAGFVVDELHGEHQTVIKPLGKVFENISGLTGATVLGDGNVALILDVQGLIQKAVKGE